MKKIALLLFILILSGTSQEIGARYLIITHDSFYDAALPLVEWKHKKGMRAKIVKLSEIGSTQNQIRNYIVDAYNNWQIQPEYLLLVGAPNFIPFPQVYGWYSDNYYTNVEGDIYNEILSGRLTVHSVTEAQTVVNKILTYEKTPYREDSLWFKKATLIVRMDWDPPDDSIYWSDAHFAAGLMVEHGFVEIDTLSNFYGHDRNHVINGVNNGRSIVMYRGVGFNNWSPPFDVIPNQTQNGAKLPIVISTTCRTIGTGSTPATAETWLLVGTPTNPKGASGYFATTTTLSGQAYLRSAVAKGFHNALFNEAKETFGQACEGGRRNVYEMYRSSGPEEYVGFTTLGDPEMNIWTDTPCSLEVQHPIYVSVGNTNFTVIVTRAVSAIPICNARVCIMSKIDTTIYMLDSTDTFGTVTFDITSNIPNDTLFITVTGKNLQPYEGLMVVRPDRCFIVYLNSTVNDSAQGNNDGKINPTEEIDLPLWIINLGESTGVNITGTLISDDPYITLTDSVKDFGDILGHDSAFTDPDGYNFSVAHSCSNGHHIDFELRCTDINDSLWVSIFSKTVSAPDFFFNGKSVSGGNGNNIAEPGETVSVVVTLKNQGDASADSVYAILQSASSEITILDSTGTYGHIGVDSVKDNTSDPYVIYVDSSTSTGTIINMNLAVFSNYRNQLISFNLIIGQKNYYIWDTDPAPGSAQNIHTILTNLGYKGDYSRSFPALPPLYQAIFVCLGVYPNRTVIADGAQAAIALTDYLNNGGRLYIEGSAVWYIDPVYFNGHNFGPLFGISGVGWSPGDMGPVSGQPGTFTDGMVFNYSGENNYMDHMNPSGSGFLIFRDQNDGYDCGMANDAGNYRTVGLSFELGWLTDGSPPSTREVLLDSIMKFFAITAGITEDNNLSSIDHYSFTVQPNPCRGRVNIKYSIGSNTENAELKIYDVSGRFVKGFNLQPATNDQQSLITWQGDDNAGQRLSQGIYFIRLIHKDYAKVKKVIFLH